MQSMLRATRHTKQTNFTSEANELQTGERFFLSFKIAHKSTSEHAGRKGERALCAHAGISAALALANPT